MHAQVTQAIVKNNAPDSTTLGIVPMGTANDFATGLGIPEDPWEAMQLAIHDTARPIDVGTVNDEVCTAGPYHRWEPDAFDHCRFGQWRLKLSSIRKGVCLRVHLGRPSSMSPLVALAQS